MTTTQTMLTLRSNEAREQIMTWFGTLQSEHKNAERAQLRRCASVAEVLWHREYYSLLSKLKANGIQLRYRSDEHALAAIVGLLAHVKTHNSSAKIGRQLAQTQNGKRGLSDLRFRRLLAAQTIDEVAPHFRRAIQLKDGAINVHSLLQILSQWRPDAEYASPGANPRIQLAEQFYSVK